jgi:tRNA nucleotidyltransferase (CCA-adding enzyme)
MEWPEQDELFQRALALPAVAGVARRLSADPEVRVAAVGGAVRDLVLGLPVEDVDLAVEGPVEPVLARLGGPARSHIRFGTATVELDGSRLDLARTRRESYPQPGALPEVSPGTLEEDLQRRDFTVNALAVPLTGAGRGRVLAVPHARGDLEGGRLRVLHPASFIDDPTRLFRLARYRARLGFEAEPETAELADRAVDGGAVATLTGPRIGHELELICAEADPVAAWGALRGFGLDEAVEPGFGVRDPEGARRALALLPADGRPEVILLALAVAGVARDRRGALLDRLGIPARTRDDAVLVTGRVAGVAQSLREARSRAEIAAAVGEAAAVELAALAGALGAEGQAREWLHHLRHLELQIGGDDLLAAGVAPGPALGAGLAAARTALLDGRADSREEQLAEALRVARRAG